MKLILALSIIFAPLISGFNLSAEPVGSRISEIATVGRFQWLGRNADGRAEIFDTTTGIIYAGGPIERGRLRYAFTYIDLVKGKTGVTGIIKEIEFLRLMKNVLSPGELKQASQALEELDRQEDRFLSEDKRNSEPSPARKRGLSDTERRELDLLEKEAKGILQPHEAKELEAISPKPRSERLLESNEEPSATSGEANAEADSLRGGTRR